MRLPFLVLTTLAIADAFMATTLGSERLSSVGALASSRRNAQTATATKIETKTVEAVSTVDLDLDIADIFPMPKIKNKAVQLTASEINSRLTEQLTKMQAKDQMSYQLQKEVSSSGGCFKCYADFL